jgi:hypothetical protein
MTTRIRCRSRSILTLLTLSALTGPSVQAQVTSSFSPQPITHHDVASGMLLGVYAITTSQGLQITSTIPGYSAEGRLFAGDVLLQTTAANMPMFSIRSHDLMEHAKSVIGPFREAAVEFYRPGVGLMYAWVTFQPITSQPHIHSQPQPAITGQLPGTVPPFGTGSLPLNSNNASPNMAGPIGPPLNGNSTSMRSTIGPQGSRGANAGNPNNFSPFSHQFPGGQFNPNTGNFHDQPLNGNNFQPKSAAPGGQFQAEFRLESEKPGARKLFQGNGGQLQLGPSLSLPNTTTLKPPSNTPGPTFGRKFRSDR